MQIIQTPGVYKIDRSPPPETALRTGVPVFLGLAAKGEPYTPTMLTRRAQFDSAFGSALPNRYLEPAVRGFFANAGQLCYVMRLADDSPDALARGLEAISTLENIDLVCAPDIMSMADRALIPAMQRVVMNHCLQQGNRFAILDALPGADVAQVLEQRRGLSGASGALYYPWVRVDAGPPGQRFLPPCGHIAGIYARTDREIGVHKAPANALLEGVLDLQINLNSRQQERLNPVGINCLRSFPGRGIRVWGARTLSDETDWSYINVRRLFLTAGRWIEHNMTAAMFDPNDPRLWARINRELTAYCLSLFQQGALRGNTPAEAFYIKCDAETNPPEVRERGEVIAEIGLAPGAPAEFVVVQIVRTLER